MNLCWFSLTYPVMITKIYNIIDCKVDYFNNQLIWMVLVWKIDQKQVENVECFKCLSSMLTNDGRCTCEIKSSFAMAKAVFCKKKTLFTSKLDLNLRKKLIKCYIWSMAFYGAETGRFGQQMRNTWKVLKCGAGEGWIRSVGPIMWEKKKCYLESMSRGISYTK